MRRLTMLVASLGLCISSPQPDAKACTDQNSWTGPIPIPIYLNYNLVDLCAATNCTSVDAIRWTLEKAAHQWYSETGANLRFYITGFTSAPPGYLIDNAITVYATSGCNGYAAQIIPYSLSRRGIEICTDELVDGTYIWRPDSGLGGGPSLQAVFIHELGHVLSFSHPESYPCGEQPDKSVMRASEWEDGSHLFKYDIDQLVSKYGYRTSVPVARYTSNGTSWNGGFSAPGIAGYSRGRFPASNSRGGSISFLTWTDQQYGTTNVSRYDGTGWSYLAGIPFGTTNYHSGVASSSNNTARVQFLGAYQQTTGKQTVYESTTTNAGVSWSFPTALSTSASFSDTSSDGVASTFDPKSSKFVRVWRGGFDNGSGVIHTNQIFYKVDTGVTYRLLEAQSQPYLSSDTPSLTCGPAALGTYNCLLAWTDGSTWLRYVRWTQFYVNGSIIKTTTVNTHSAVSMCSPTVAYYNHATHPFMIAINQGGAYT